MKIKIFSFNSFQVNTIILHDNSNECVIIDAGCNTEQELATVTNFIEQENLNPKYILNTHCHVDHVMGNLALKEKYSINFMAHENEMPLIERTRDMATAFGLDVDEPGKPDKFIDDGEIIKFGNTELQAIHVPGHSPGSICYHIPKEKILIAGDVLFQGSIGRTDLPGGDYDTLINGIKSKLLILSEDTIVYPGHGESTTIKFEKENNPYLT